MILEQKWKENSRQKKAQVQVGTAQNFTSPWKEELKPVLLTLLHKTEKERMLPNSCDETSIITFIAKSDKEIIHKKL